MKTIVIANQKGGVGKTTTAVNIADVLIHCDYKTLFIDLDPQANSTSTYGAEIENQNTIYDIMEKTCSVKDAIQHTDFGDIVPGDPMLTTLEMKLTSQMLGYKLLKKSLEAVDAEYDYCIIDTPPNLGVFMLNGLMAADSIIIPVQAKKYALDGLNRLLSTINDVLTENPNLQIAGVLLTSYDKRNELDRKIWEALPQTGEEIGLKVFEQPIRICQDIVKAQDFNDSLIELYPTSNAAYDYTYVTNEVLKQLSNQ